MYRSWSALWEGWTKNLYLGANRSWGMMVYMAAIMLSVIVIWQHYNLRRLDAEISDKRISNVVQAPGFIRGINPKSKIENPQAPAFIRGVNLKSKI